MPKLRICSRHAELVHGLYRNLRAIVAERGQTIFSALDGHNNELSWLYLNMRRKSLPSLERAIWIADKLGVTIDDLLRENQECPKPDTVTVSTSARADDNPPEWQH